MKCDFKAEKGFTLIEVIVVLALVGIMVAIAGIGYVHVVKGTLFTKMNADTIQKGEIAITRLIKEFNNMSISSVTAADGTSITFSSVKDGDSTPHTVALTGDTITYDGDIITDQVSEFSLIYFDNYDAAGQTTWATSRRIIEITLKLKGAEDVVSEFKARVKPRNL